MRTNAAVTSVLFAVLLMPACSRHSATTGTAPVVAPAPAPAVEPPALEPMPAPVPATPAPVVEPTPVPAPVVTEPVPPPILNPTLEQATSLAENGQPEQARRVYLALLNSTNVPRATIAAGAQGLYRLGAYADAVEAFRNLGTFIHGEEDLRYYNAVSLFETGHYDDAKKELACALPYIQITPEVSRYRDKIEKMGSPQAMKK